MFQYVHQENGQDYPVDAHTIFFCFLGIPGGEINIEDLWLHLKADNVIEWNIVVCFCYFKLIIRTQLQFFI